MEVDADAANANMVRDNAVVNIAADGDVIMVVGPNKKKFRLDSSVLTTKSMNFNTMLNPKIVEGRQLITEGHRLIAKGHLLIANEEPVKIDLPEDDIESMDFIFTTIHHAFDVLSNPVFSNPKEIPFFEILVAANKYGLVFAIKNTLLLALFAETADEDTLKGMLGEKLWKLTMASAFVEDAAAFKAVTRALVLHQQGEYLDFAEQWYFTELFALRVCANLEKKRAYCRQRAMQELLWVCKSKSNLDGPKFQVEYTIGAVDPDFFIETSVSNHLDLIEGCVEYQNGDRHTDDEGTYWMDVLKENAGLDLNRFV